MRFPAITVACFLLPAMLAGLSYAADTVVVVADGQAKCSVVVGAEEAFQEPRKANWKPKRKLLEWAAEDLATYLGKMSGATVQVADKPVDGLLPIYVGCAPAPPKLTRATEFGDAYVVDVTKKRIVKETAEQAMRRELDEAGDSEETIEEKIKIAYKYELLKVA